jgi:perosamine synthetase
MIPRFKPYLGMEELLAAFTPNQRAMERFEEEFARTFEANHALAFSYGRSALWALFNALDIKNAEVVLPAYTCVVVAHAIVLSGNRPRFVDITLKDYNMDLDEVQAAINENTRAIIATHLFGYPLDVDRLTEIVRDAENHFGHKIWVIQDCAHAFGARWKGKLVCNEKDVALFGLNISKTIISIFGGMLTTHNAEFAARLRDWRDSNFIQPGMLKSLRRCIYLLSVYPAFEKHIYGLVNWLEERTPLLNHFTKAYHLDGIICLPPDYLDMMTDIEARVGLVQLQKYPEILHSRLTHAGYYAEHLRGVPCLVLPPIVEGATYSHYPVLVRDRRPWFTAARKAGVQLGQLIEYSIPEMPSYRQYKDQDFPNSLKAMNGMINLPVHACLSKVNRERLTESLLSIARDQGLSGTI